MPETGEQDKALGRARALVRRHGRAATCWQVLHPAMTRWFDPAGDGVVGHVTYGRVRVAAGEPVCAPERLPAVCRAFEADAGRANRRVCYLAAESALVNRLATSGHHTIVPIGAQPVWRPADLARVFRSTAALRYQRNRARNKGVRVGEWPATQSSHPGLAQCLADWLHNRPLPALGFMTDPYLLPRMAGRRLFVAQQAGHPVGFAVLSPVPARRGWLVEQIVRGGLAPNGTAESLVAAAAEAVAAGGSRFFTLGAAPLARRGPQRSDRHPLWLRAVTAWMRAHGTRFYNFRGLEHFKAKLAPRRWEPVFAVANESRLRPATLYAVLGAFAGRSPAWGLIQAVGRGLATEIKNLNGSLLTTGSK